MIPPIRPRCLLASAALTVAAVLVLPPARAADAQGQAAPRVREPAVAGLFYPKDPAALSRMIDTMLDAARTEPGPGDLRALICPHAGYPYSGPVAASAYRLLKGRSYETVIVLGPSHYAELRAGSVTEDSVFRTPLGDVPVSARAGVLAGMRPFALDPNCRVVRPDWAAESSRAVPARETADTWEHSVEVEVPFLQKTLTGFQILPVVCGEFDEEQAARALERVLDDRTLVVVSSDLSHYNPYASARRIDAQTVDAIVHLNAAAVGDSDACGHTPIRTLLHVARHKGWQARVLDVRNSGDTAGDKSRVVGYAAIAFYAPPAGKLTAADRKYLLDLARRTLREAAATGGLPTVPTGGLAAELTRERGCFVTLTRRGELRGCIGYILPQGPLVQAVVENARNAAIKDPRFLPVTAREVDGLDIEISVLTEPQRLAFSSPEDLLERLRPGIDGVVLQIGRRTSTYLPQVWEQIPDREQFLDSLAQKGGSAPDAWRGADVSVFVYQAEAFKESEPGSAP